MQEIRPSWEQYFIEIALVVAKRATCLRRCYGAVITDSRHNIISTGYCGSPRGTDNCTALGVCKRQQLNIPSGERYELCRSVHAEQNALLLADAQKMIGGTIYVAGFVTGTKELATASPCLLCAKMINNSQLSKVVYQDSDGIIHTVDPIQLLKEM